MSIDAFGVESTVKNASNPWPAQDPLFRSSLHVDIIIFTSFSDDIDGMTVMTVITVMNCVDSEETASCSKTHASCGTLVLYPAVNTAKE